VRGGGGAPHCVAGTTLCSAGRLLLQLQEAGGRGGGRGVGVLLLL